MHRFAENSSGIIALHEPRVWIITHDDVRYTVAVLRLIVLVLQDPSCSHCDTRWQGPFVADEKTSF